MVKPGAPKGVRVDLKIGDMLIYAGCELEHWREPFQGNRYVHKFFYITTMPTAHLLKRILLDGRPLLGVI